MSSCSGKGSIKVGRKKDFADKCGISFRCDSSSTPLKVFQSRGWRRVHDTRDFSWDLWWCDTCDLKLVLDGASKLNPRQRVSHFRNHCELTRKNYLYRNLKRYKRLLLKAGKVKEAELCEAMPISFEMPSEYRMLVEEHRKRHGTTWIAKPDCGSQGRGIFLFQKLKDVPDWKVKDLSHDNYYDTDPAKDPTPQDNYLVQKYIDDPYLIDGCKFDLRLYVLVTSFQPLKVWLAREGFARLSGERFSLQKIGDTRVHLTNMSIQLRQTSRTNANSNNTSSSSGNSKRTDDSSNDQQRFAADQTQDAKLGRKWPLSCLNDYLVERHGEKTVDELRHKIAEKDVSDDADSVEKETENSSEDRSDSKTVAADIKIEKINISTPKTHYKKSIKTLRVSWMNRSLKDEKFHPVDKPLGGVKKIKLNERFVYTANEIKQMAMKKFVGRKKLAMNDMFLVNLGFSDGTTISEFRRPDGGICDIWGYCKALDTSLYKLQLFLLTTPKDKDISLTCLKLNGKKLLLDQFNTPDWQPAAVPKDSMRIFYHYIKISKYTSEMSFTEFDNVNLYNSVLEDHCGDGPSMENFDPMEYGHTISRIEKGDRVLLQITLNDDKSKTIEFPSAPKDLSLDSHSIVHDVDEVQGVYNGSFGIGVVPSCASECEPVFTWYKNGKVFKKGDNIYWLNGVQEINDDDAHTWYCSIYCKVTKSEIKSKVVQISKKNILDGDKAADCNEAMLKKP